MRKAAIIIAVIVAVIVVAAVVFWATFDVNKYHGRIQAELENRLGRKVTLGQMHLSLAPPSFQVNNLTIADDPSFHDPKPFVQAAQLNVSVKLGPLLHKNVEISSLTLQRPVVELIKNQQGVWNFASLGNAQQPSPTTAPATTRQAAPAAPAQNTAASTSQQPSSGGQKFSLNELSIQDGQVALSDRQAGQPRTVYNDIDLTLNDFAPDKPFSVRLAAHLPGPGSQALQLQGTGGPIVQGDVTTTPFHGTLNLNNVQLSGLSKFLNSPALANTNGTITGETKIDSDNGKLAADGGMTIQQPVVHGVDIGYPISSQYNLSDDLKTDLVNISSATVKLGQTPLAVNGTLNMKPTPMDLNLNLKADNVSLAEAARLASAFGVAFAPGVTVNGQATANIHATGPATKPALNGTLSARNVQASGKDMPQPVSIPAVNFQLTPTDIRSDNFNIVSGNTTVNSNLALSRYTSNSPVIAANLQAPNAQLPAILSMAKAYGVTALDKISGAGVMNLNMHLSGPVKSITSDQILAALNGNAGLNFSNLRVTGVDIAHQVAGIAGFLKNTNQGVQNFTNIAHMTGNVTVNNGVARTNNLQAQLDIGTLGVNGTANLVSKTLNLRANAVLSKPMSQQVGGTNIGGYMQTALANNQGELVIPVLITGTFDHPVIAPDVQGLAQMKLKGLVPNANNPQSAVSGILGNLLGQNKQDQQQQQNPAQNAVQQVLGNIFGGNKKQQQQQNPPKPPK